MASWLVRAGYLLAREWLWLRSLGLFLLGHTDGIVWLIVHRRWDELTELARIVEEQDERPYYRHNGHGEPDRPDQD